MANTEKEREIPVLTVWKNNYILKNIFLINNQENGFDYNDNMFEFEEILMVGRHPDCNIRLEHPSVSRFHLKIHSLPSKKLLFVTDLSSVHGTWVSGRRIEPNIRTIVKEGDDLRIGGSSRVYKLLWIPLSQAYDVLKPFVPPFDLIDLQEDEDKNVEDDIPEGLNAEEVDSVNISDEISKGLDPTSLCADDQMVAEIVLPQVPVSLKDGAIQLEDIKFDGLDTLSLDDISQELQHTEMLLTTQVHNEDFEDKNDQSVDLTLGGPRPFLMGDISEEAAPQIHYDALEYEDVKSVDSILEGLVPLLICDLSQEVAPQIHNEGLENEDVQSVDSMSEGLVPLFMGENWEWIGQQENYLPCPTEDHGLVNSVPERLDTLSMDKDSQLLAQQVTPVSPPMSDEMEFSTAENVDNIIAEEKQENVPEILGEDVQDSAWSFWTSGSPQNTDFHLTVMENENIRRESEPKNEPSVSMYSDLNSPSKEDQESELWSFWSGKMGVESVCSVLSDKELFSESGNRLLTNGYLSSPCSSLKNQEITPVHRSARGFWSRREKLQSSDISLPSAELFSDSENESPKSLSSVNGRFESPLIISDQNPISSIWSRREKIASAPQVLPSRTEEKKMKTDQVAEEVFTPEKENFTPNAHRSMRKFAVLKEINNSNSGKTPLLKMISSPKCHSEDFMSPLLGKENYSSGTPQKRKTVNRASANKVQSVNKLIERNRGRIPFQSLPTANSPQNIITQSSECHIDDVTCKGKCVREELRQWNIVVDTTTLLNKESRSALQLLEGLKGTKLIIPRIVITELTSLKRQRSFFRRNTEVLYALEWIQDCMLKAGWWIHVQNSMEESQPVAPTPPASPLFQLSYALSSFISRSEVLSPTVEDDILDFALSFRKNNYDGQLVLLSNDVTMKVKAMAEGMICETGEEFRESLVNPFSERFRWTDSSPRGQTWSCEDDFVLKEKFYPSSLKMAPKSRQNVKGLKLILLHNSRHHEQITTIH